MTVQLNHTIVWCRDKIKSSSFLTEILGLPPATVFGPMMVVPLGNGASLDFYAQDNEIAMQHYAFLVSEEEFDQILARVRERGMTFWSLPGKQFRGEINHVDGGRGFYFDDPDGHFLEVITRPYGGLAGSFGTY
ncbi:MAG: VOC family protein [Betaproteobacteria bacterium]